MNLDTKNFICHCTILSLPQSMAPVSVLFLLTVLLFAHEVAAQTNNSNIIRLGWWLSPNANRISWVSSSGLFAFGFYPQANGFAIGVWLVGDPKNTIVWTANRDAPPLPFNSTLELTKNGQLLLRTGQGKEEFFFDPSEQADSASMLDSGNFVLYGKGVVKWQTFDHPTDTILGGQIFSAGGKLISSKSEWDHSSGHFILSIDDGQMIARPNTSSMSSDEVYLSYGSGFDRLKLTLEGSLVLSGDSNYHILVDSHRLQKNKTFVYRATLDANGVFTLYAHRIEGKASSILFTVWSARSIQAIPKTKVVTASKRSLTVILAITLGSIACFCLAIAMFVFFIYRRQLHGYTKLSRVSDLGLNEECSLRSFSFEELVQSTGGFTQKISRGSFGDVYKGTICGSNKQIAVKRLERVVEEGERKFRAEITALARTHHRNLVQLIGFCIEGSQKLLVYDYMSNGSLADHLFRTEIFLPWKDRVRIALEVATGILYLHEECELCIVHYNLQPQNILLDESWTPKISDFGLARLLIPKHSRTNAGVEGISGYLAPEWQNDASIFLKSDIYSYGVVLLEIICRRRNIKVNVSSENEIILSSWVYDCFVKGELNKLVADEDVDSRTLERMVKVGLWCVQEDPNLRPSMKNVTLMLAGLKDIPIPPSPAPVV